MAFCAAPRPTEQNDGETPETSWPVAATWLAQLAVHLREVAASAGGLEGEGQGVVLKPVATGASPRRPACAPATACRPSPAAAGVGRWLGGRPTVGGGRPRRAHALGPPRGSAPSTRLAVASDASVRMMLPPWSPCAMRPRPQHRRPGRGLSAVPSLLRLRGRGALKGLYAGALASDEHIPAAHLAVLRSASPKGKVGIRFLIATCRVADFQRRRLCSSPRLGLGAGGLYLMARRLSPLAS